MIKVRQNLHPTFEHFQAIASTVVETSLKNSFSNTEWSHGRIDLIRRGESMRCEANAFHTSSAYNEHACQFCRQQKAK
ncbi:hypothetical protein T11_14281 [Trichinella zimbabwensis]|uniref:Uncharacterized protein n=1 Tax=Trichinella zimbabwensis TaxID=268475 RepID=A0A0V1HA46_9BILA|nr:hypothetical protein T11_14281 [Trichinella zimbabwensis]